jgi:hypothetical protein
VSFKKDHIGPVQFGEVVDDTGADDSTSDHDYLRT